MKIWKLLLGSQRVYRTLQALRCDRVEQFNAYGCMAVYLYISYIWCT